MKRTVMIVDDEPQLLRLLVRAFEQEGYTVFEAKDGTIAIELFNERHAEIDAMVLDVIVPPSGAEAILQVVLPQKPNLALVLASGDNMAQELTELMLSHGGIFLRKPFLPRELIRVVNEMIETAA